MVSLCHCILSMSVCDFVFAILGVVCKFTSWAGCKSDILSWKGSMQSLFVLALHRFDVIKVGLSACVTYLIVSSINSLWSVSSTKLN